MRRSRSKTNGSIRSVKSAVGRVVCGALLVVLSSNALAAPLADPTETIRELQARYEWINNPATFAGRGPERPSVAQWYQWPRCSSQTSAALRYPAPGYYDDALDPEKNPIATVRENGRFIAAVMRANLILLVDADVFLVPEAETLLTDLASVGGAEIDVKSSALYYSMEGQAVDPALLAVLQNPPTAQNWQQVMQDVKTAVELLTDVPAVLNSGFAEQMAEGAAGASSLIESLPDPQPPECANWIDNVPTGTQVVRTEDSPQTAFDIEKGCYNYVGYGAPSGTVGSLASASGSRTIRVTDYEDDPQDPYWNGGWTAPSIELSGKSGRFVRDFSLWQGSGTLLIHGSVVSNMGLGGVSEDPPQDVFNSPLNGLHNKYVSDEAVSGGGQWNSKVFGEAPLTLSDLDNVTPQGGWDDWDLPAGTPCPDDNNDGIEECDVTHQEWQYYLSGCGDCFGEDSHSHRSASASWSVSADAIVVFTGLTFPIPGYSNVTPCHRNNKQIPDEIVLENTHPDDPWLIPPGPPPPPPPPPSPNNLPEQPGPDSEEDQACEDESEEVGGGGIARDPVRMATGDKIESAQDLHVALPGPNFRLTRSYNSRPGYWDSSAYGQNWTNGTQKALVPADSTLDQLLVTGMDGTTNAIFNKVGNKWESDASRDQFISRRSVRVRFPLVSTGTYTIVGVNPTVVYQYAVGGDLPIGATHFELLRWERADAQSPWIENWISIGNGDPIPATNLDLNFDGLFDSQDFVQSDSAGDVIKEIREPVVYAVYETLCWTRPGADRTYFYDFYSHSSAPGGANDPHLAEALEGRVLLEEDAFGQRRTYEYTVYDNHDNGVQVAASSRLAALYLDGERDTASATVLFDWYVGGNQQSSGSITDNYDTNNDVILSDPISGDDTVVLGDESEYPEDLWGKLARVRVLRANRDGSAAPKLTQQVDYVYQHRDDFDDDGTVGIAEYLAPLAVGDVGSLIMVVKRTVVDQAEAGEPYRVRAWHYRYHDGAPAVSDGDAAGRDLIEGKAGQMKAVFLPEQVEHWIVNESSASAATANEYVERATELLQVSDGLSRDYATKLIGYDRSSASGYVTQQFVQADCGCGSSGQTRKIEYAYSGLSPITGVPWMVHKFEKVKSSLTELTWDEQTTAWVPYRENVWDFERLRYDDALPDVERATYASVMNRIVREIQAGGGAAQPREWVTKYVYNNDHLVEEIHTPSANVSYSSTTHAAVSSLSAGSIWHYTYHPASKRVSSVSIAEGTDDVLPDLLWSTEFPTSAGTDTRYPIPIGANQYRLADASVVSTDAAFLSSDVETVRASYRFASDLATAVEFYRPLWVRSESEQELTAENGPSDGLSGGSYEKVYMYDPRGQVVWIKHEDGTLEFIERQVTSGKVTKRVRNASPNATSHSPAFLPEEWGVETLTGSDQWGHVQGPELTTRMVVDEMGRVLSSVDERGVEVHLRRESTPNSESPGVLQYSLLRLPMTMASGANEYSGLAVRSWFDGGGRLARRSGFALASPPADYPESFTLAAEETRSTNTYARSGQRTSSKRWHDLNGIWHGGVGASDPATYYEDSFEYDELGRMSKLTMANGDVFELSHDVKDRVTSVSRGIDGGSSDVIAEYFYDADDGSGVPVSEARNGLLTHVVRYTGETPGTGLTSDVRTERRFYDERDRLRLAESDDAPTQAIDYDNLDRPLSMAAYSSRPSWPSVSVTDAAADRGALTKLSYGQRGRVSTSEIAIDPAATSPKYLRTDNWFDERGRLLGTAMPGGKISKRVIDSLGRTVTSSVSTPLASVAPGTALFYDSVSEVDADGRRVSTVANDFVIEQVDYAYSEIRNLLSTETQRLRSSPDAGVTSFLGSLSMASGPDVGEAVAVHRGVRYDDAARVTHMMNFGTGSSDGLFRSEDGFVADPENPSADVLTQSIEYDYRGLVVGLMSPQELWQEAENQSNPGTHTVTSQRYYYDDLFRKIGVVEAADDATLDLAGTDLTIPGPGGSPAVWAVSGVEQLSTDLAANPPIEANSVDEGQDRVTGFVLDAANNITAMVAYQPDGAGGVDTQITEYRYGAGPTSPEASLIASNSLRFETVYPDGGVVRYGYNRLGEVRAVVDQRGVRREFTRDDLGRITQDKVTSFGSSGSVDTWADALQFTYNDFGLLTESKTLNGAAVQNIVRFSHNGLWLVETAYQDIDGDGVAPERSVEVDWALEEFNAGAGNYVRRNGMMYPADVEATASSSTMSFNYSGTLESRLSRVSGVSLSAGATSGLVDYSYIGMARFAQVDFPSIDIMLDRTLDQTGVRRVSPAHLSQNQGVYPGFDSFGRSRYHAWADGNLTDAVGTDLPSRPPRFAEVYAYDRDSNRTAKFDARPGASQLGQDFKFEYDELDRLVASKRGVVADAFTDDLFLSHSTLSTAWQLDTLGNWDARWKDFDADGVVGEYDSTPGSEHATEVAERRTHNQVNEDILKRFNFGYDAQGGGVTYSQQSFGHDDAGNMTSQGFGTDTDTYTFDAWNRLTKTDYTAFVLPSAITEAILRQEYNALGWRTVKSSQPELPRDGTNWQRREMYYSPSWQLVEERVYDGVSQAQLDNAETTLPDVDRVVQYFWGERYIDDIIMHRIARRDGTTAPSGSSADGYDALDTFYHLTDAQFSTVALYDAQPKLIERVRYGAYGEAQHMPPYDLTADGVLDASDQTEFVNALAGGLAEMSLGGTHYRADLDVDSDGVYSLTDYTNTLAGMQPAPAESAGPTVVYGARGALSQLEPQGAAGTDHEPDNQIGYAGYVFNPEIQAYTVRFRHYSPQLGRWLSRDPLGYVDGLNSREYVTSSPSTWNDPLGLKKGSFSEQFQMLLDARANCTEGDKCFQRELDGALLAGMLVSSPDSGELARVLGEVSDIGAEIAGAGNMIGSLEEAFDELDEIGGIGGEIFDALEEIAEIGNTVGKLDKLFSAMGFASTFLEITAKDGFEVSGTEYLQWFSEITNTASDIPGFGILIHAINVGLDSSLVGVDVLFDLRGARNAKDFGICQSPSGSGPNSAWSPAWTMKILREHGFDEIADGIDDCNCNGK